MKRKKTFIRLKRSEARKKKHLVLDLYKNGHLSAREISQRLCLNESTVRDWLKQIKVLGYWEFMGPDRKRPTIKPKLSDDQLRELLTLTRKGAKNFGYIDNQWNQKRVALLVKQHFGVEYDHVNLNRFIERRLGISPDWNSKTKRRRFSQMILIMNKNPATSFGSKSPHWTPLDVQRYFQRVYGVYYEEKHIQQKLRRLGWYFTKRSSA